MTDENNILEIITSLSKSLHMILYVSISWRIRKFEKFFTCSQQKVTELDTPVYNVINGISYIDAENQYLSKFEYLASSIRTFEFENIQKINKTFVLLL